VSGNRPAKIFRQKLPARRAPSPSRLAAFLGLLAILLGAASLHAQSPTSPTKEYIRAGGKLIAIEIPGAGAAISVSVTPQTPPALGPGGTQQFAASVSGSSNQTVTWTVSSGLGTVSSTGLYTAPSTITSTSSAIVRATSEADTSKFDQVTITLNPPATVTVSVSPTSVQLGPSESQQFFATVTGAANTAVTWSKLSGLGSVNQTSGIYTAPSTITAISTATVRATSNADNTKHADATITLIPPGTAPPVVVSVLPSNPYALGPSENIALTAIVSNASNPAVNWTWAPNVGVIATSGGFTSYNAPASIASQQTVVATATSSQDNSKSASVTLTLRPVASTPTPLVTYLTPSTPTTQDVTFNLNAQGGSADVSQLRLYLGFDGTDVGDCLILYDRLTNTLLLRSDGSGESWLSAIGIGSSQTQENSQCKIFGSGSSALNFGRNTQLAIRVQSKPAFAGNRVMKVWLNNTNNQSWGWADVGNWIVPASTNYVTPPVRSLFPGQFVQLSSVTTPAGQTVNWSISPSVGTLNATTGFYTAPSSISSQQTVTVTARRQSDNSVVGAATLTLKPISGSGTPAIPAFAEIVPGTSQRNGLAEVFKFRLTDQQGPLTIDEVRVRFTPSTNTTNANNCSFRWSRNGSVLELFNDAGTKLEGPIGTGTPNLSNSACTLIGASLNAYSWGTPGGYNPFELILGIGFQGAFASGTKNIEVSARDNTGLELPLASRGTWTFSSSGAAPSLEHTITGGYPQGVGTTTQKFAITITDANGVSDINDIQFVITDRTGTPPQIPAPNTCHIFYFPGSDVALTLADDGLQWADIGELNPGWPFQSNSQCDFFVSDTDYLDGTSPSTQKVFRPKFRLKGSFATSSKNVYAKVSDNSGLVTAYQYVTSFTVNGSSNQPVYFTPRSEIDPTTGKPRVWVEITGADSVEPHTETGLGREEE
jgi:hypothetical protein